MKHTSRFMFFASLIAAFGMLCCSEDNDTTEDNDISNCTDGTWKCDGNTLSKCISGKWETIHICDENTLCNIATGTCAPNDTSNCTDGTWKCDGNTLSKCASGKWEFSQTCKENTQCNAETGTCEANDVSECTDGSWKCDGDILSKCASGKWEWVQACAPYEQCNAETGTCDIFVVPDCAEDEHIWDNTCEKNSIENCIWHGSQCKTGKNAKSTCDSEYGCTFECNEGFGQYVTGITVIDSYISTAGKHVSFVNHTLSDECVPAFQSKWKLTGPVIIPIDFPKDKSESITIDWGDGTFTHITSETEIDSYEYYANSYEHMVDCLKPSYATGYRRCSYTYFGKKNNNNTYAVHYYLGYTEADYDTVRIVGTSNWSCPVENSYLSDAVCNNRDLISIQSYGNITFGERAFLSADNLESLPAESPRLSNNITGFFQGARKFNQDINFWNTSNVTDMSYMFCNAETFNQPLNNWDTSKVTDMSGMFLNAYTFNQPLNNWNTSNVIDMSGMFNGAIAFNQPLNNWDTSNVTKMGGVGIFGFGMFQAATSFNQPLNNWNTSKVTNIRNMFKGASAFNQPLDQWDVSNVLFDPSNTYSGDGVFRDSGLQKDNYCKLFAGPYSSNWNLIDLGLTYDCEDTCQNGNCNNTCNDNECFYNNSCVNQDNHCGKQCLNCNTFTPHATAGTCNNNGTCQVTACETGYHVNNNACEADSTISCNDNECFYNNSCINQNDHCGKQCLNCNTFTPHATAGTCNNYGTCQVTACEAGYHTYNNACEADSISNCGTHGNQCNVANATNTICSNGICQATACEAGYHVYNNACEADSISNCGTHGNQCNVANATNTICSNGTCQATACYAGYHLYNNACEVDSTSNCGAHGNQCNGANTTNTICSNGICQTCNTGYHTYNNTCEADSTANCGTHGNQCNVPHATNICSDGTCLVSACNTGYHIYNNTCEVDSTTNCGTHGKQCNNLAIENATNTCSAGVCTFICNPGYEKMDDACVKPMISIWKGQTITFPIQGRIGTIIINWGDGKSDTITSGESKYIEHNYSTSGTHTISVRGTINNWSCYFNFTSLCEGLVSIQSYGDTIFGSRAFSGATNLVSLPTKEIPQFYNNSMYGTFQGAYNFNQNINFWDTSNVTNMGMMFYGAKLFNQPLNNWDTSNVKSMEVMFANASAFNQPLNNWNTSNVTNMSGMFSNTAFNQPLNNWNTSNVTNMSMMFLSTKAFNQPLDNWDTSNVTNMNEMFLNTKAFNQPLDKWNISKVTNMADIFSSSGLDKSNYCKLFTGAYSSYWNKYKGSLGKSYTCN